MTIPRPARDDLRAAMAARRELGPDYDEAFIDSVVDRIEETLAPRASRFPAPAPAPRRASPKPSRETGERDHSLALAVLSLLAAIPLSAISVVNGGLPALMFVLTMIVILNVTYMFRPRRD
ncbi:hypothetical protein [Actinomadura sp. NEAU-AAG7]|uniref:hypothetical protein n=1 Tax=Actinomadura sp. NEAU-AAG7 TaxID=2839640 RepID=UPI001BE46048|nr:hypothetical protein [Actinomadura sp. NEAU-AAG7]MBT2211664.1 hypothetical protein [Actinomadura sp. NEAU-AAG7]